MNFAILSDRSLIEISGDDAEAFLDNILTCKVIGLENGEASFGALLTPQGKILFDFFLIKTDTGFLFDVAQSLSEDFAKRLTFYRLRAKVSIEPKLDLKVFARWGDDIQTTSLAIFDPRLKELGIRQYSEEITEREEGNYLAHRIECGIPQGGHDFEYGEAYPHEALMDQFGGVDFKKGCYVGQEVISRMQHRGTTKKRVVIVSSDTPLPISGTPILADGKPAGFLGSRANNKGLALLRLDRVSKANEVLADSAKLQATVPSWVDFKMPENT